MGFVLALSRRWKEPEDAYRAWARAGTLDGVPYQLGRVQIVRCEPGIQVANQIGQHGIRRGGGGEPPVRYGAIADGLSAVAMYAAAHGLSVHMPRIGAGLAGGRWEAIEAIVRTHLVARGIDVFVYDLPKR